MKVAEDFSRLVLNMGINAFDACAERSRTTTSEKSETDPQYRAINSGETTGTEFTIPLD